MDNVAISRRNHTNKGNKENAQPTHGGKSLIKRDKTLAAPFHLKSNEKDPVIPTVKQVGTKPASEALKKVNVAQKDGKVVAVPDFKQRTEALKQPAALPPTKSAPGMYKGKIVQSKIGSIWKSSATVGGVDSKPRELKKQSQRVADVTKSRTKSAGDLLESGVQKPASAWPKSVISKPTQASKPTARPPARSYSARPPARTAAVTCTNPRNTTVAPTKGGGTQNSRPKSTVSDKVNKPPVSSSLSHYRLTMETAEEKRVKLAEWLASKGKTLKRPAMTTQPKTKIFAKPEAELKSQFHCEPQPAAQCRQKQESATAAPCADTQGAGLPGHSQTPAVLDISLELLESSDADLPIGGQEAVDDIVVNLCDALEAMATPSRCNDEHTQVADTCDQMEQSTIKKEMLNEKLEDVCEQLKSKQVKKEAETRDEHTEETDSIEELESDDEGVTTPHMENASVVKYSIKTTPYLQSVKKTIEGEASTSTSRRKSNIKDLKFLTPVRRSCRIQRKSAHLPTMLVDHDPCVSSLAELVKLDDDPNAYIYRKNPALLEDLPDHPGL